MAEPVRFKGTDDERQQLLTALEHNCTCTYASDAEGGGRTFQCPGHAALVSDQQFVDDLLFARHSAPRRVGEEFRGDLE